MPSARLVDVGRQLRSGRTRTITLARPEIGVPCSAEPARHLVRTAEGLVVTVERTDGSPGAERRLVRTRERPWSAGTTWPSPRGPARR